MTVADWYDLGIFCMPKFSAYENFPKYTIINISREVLLFVCFPVQNMPSSGFFHGTCVSLVTARCHSISFCIALCSPFFAIFLDAMLKLFSDYFPWEQNETEKKWKDCNLSKNTTFFFFLKYTLIKRNEKYCNFSEKYYSLFFKVYSYQKKLKYCNVSEKYYNSFFKVYS